MRWFIGITAVVLCACEEEIPAHSFDGEASCAYIDGGHQVDMSVQGHELPDSDVITQMCWDNRGHLNTFDGKSLELPIEEEWSFIVFLREDVFTPASLRGDIEQNGDDYSIVGCEVELTLDAGRSRWLECHAAFNLADGSATLGFAETVIDATASSPSEN